MDPFSPIQVDPDPEEPRDGRHAQPPAPPGVPTAKHDPADVAMVAVQNLYILGAIDHMTDETVSGAAEVTGAAGVTGASGEPIAMRGDPLDDRPDTPAAAAQGDGCLFAGFALLLTLTLAAGSAVAALLR